MFDPLYLPPWGSGSARIFYCWTLIVILLHLTFITLAGEVLRNNYPYCM